MAEQSNVMKQSYPGSSYSPEKARVAGYAAQQRVELCQQHVELCDSKVTTNLSSPPPVLSQIGLFHGGALQARARAEAVWPREPFSDDSDSSCGLCVNALQDASATS